MLGVACHEPPGATEPSAGVTSSTPSSSTVPPIVISSSSTAGATGAPSGSASPKKAWRHPTDADGHLVMHKPDGRCYVQVPKSTPPPKDLISGERWVEDKIVSCPAEYVDPAFAAIGEGMYWIQDPSTGECSQARTFGEPPVPPTKTKCPAVLAR